MAHLSLIRIHNCLIAALAVAVGQYLSMTSQSHHPNIEAMAAAFFVCGFGNVINDLSDIAADRINHPRRALPSGRVSPAQAKTTAAMFLIISLALLFGLTLSGKIILIMAVVLLVLYNAGLARVVLARNLAVAVLGGMVFLLGGTPTGAAAVLTLPGPLVPAVLAFIMHLARELIKDMADLDGDRSTGRRTAPMVFGSRITVMAGGILIMAAIALSLAMFFVGWFDSTYLYVVLALVIIPAGAQMIWLAFEPGPDRCRTVASFMRLEMLAGMVALVIGRNY